MANYVRLGLDPTSTLKAQAQLGLKNFGLVPPLAKQKFFVLTRRSINHGSVGGSG